MNQLNEGLGADDSKSPRRSPGLHYGPCQAGHTVFFKATGSRRSVPITSFFLLLFGLLPEREGPVLGMVPVHKFRPVLGSVPVIVFFNSMLPGFRVGAHIPCFF